MLLSFCNVGKNDYVKINFVTKKKIEYECDYENRSIQVLT